MSLLQRWKQSNRIMRRVQRHGTLTTIFRAQAANGEIGSRSLPIVMGMLPPPDEMNIPTPVVADEFDGQTFDDAVPGTTQVEADSRHVSSEMPAAGTIQLKPATANVSTPAIVANSSVVAATNPGQDRVLTRSRPAESKPSQTLLTHAQSQIPAATISQKGSSLASGQAIQQQPIQGNRPVQQAATLPGKVTTGSLQAKPSTEKSAGELPAPSPQIDMAETPEANPSGLTNRVQPSASVQRTQVHTTAATAQPSTPGSPAGSGIDDRTWGRLQTIYRRHKEMDAAEETAAKKSSELLPSSPPANSTAASIQRQRDAGPRHPLSMQETLPTDRRVAVVVSQAVEFVGRPNRLRVEQSASTIDNKPAENQVAKEQPSDTPTKPATTQQGVLSGNAIQTKSTGEPAELSSVHEKTQLQSAPSATQSEQVSPTLTTIATASGVQRMPTAESATLTVPPAESGRATAEQHENISEGFDSPSAENNELHAPAADEQQVTSLRSLLATVSLQSPLF